MDLPEYIRSENDLDDLLSRPRAPLLTDIRQFQDPLLVLGASGKMGPSLCVLAHRAAKAAGHPLTIIAASRFSDPQTRTWLEAQGVQTIACDFLERDNFKKLPDSPNLVYLVGMKFGTQQNPAMTWAVNTLVPHFVCERFPTAKRIVLSTGNVYPFAKVSDIGATEQCPPSPIGEYAGAALARERIFDYFSRKQGAPTVLLRLNYAVELRYGVLADIIHRVWKNEPIDLTTGYFNCIWQGDANEMILRSLALAKSPAALFNLTGPSVQSVRQVAMQVSALMQRQPQFTGNETDTALLSNSSQLCALLGHPPTPLPQVIQWTVDWIQRGGLTFGKPTHFEVRTGQY